MVQPTDLLGNVAGKLLLVLPKGAEVDQRHELDLRNTFGHHGILIDNNLRTIVLPEGDHAVLGLPVETVHIFGIEVEIIIDRALILVVVLLLHALVLVVPLREVPRLMALIVHFLISVEWLVTL